MIGVTPLVILDELKNKVYIESLLELDLELFLHFADDADQVEQGVLNLNILRCYLAIKILVKDLLYEGIASRIKLLQ